MVVVAENTHITQFKKACTHIQHWIKQYASKDFYVKVRGGIQEDKERW